MLGDRLTMHWNDTIRQENNKQNNPNFFVLPEKSMKYCMNSNASFFNFSTFHIVVLDNQFVYYTVKHNNV
jgi:hypothetical protein